MENIDNDFTEETPKGLREQLKKEGAKISFSRVPPKWFVKGNKDKNYFKSTIDQLSIAADFSKTIGDILERG